MYLTLTALAVILEIALLQECPVHRPQSMRLFITSTRNQTGHWDTQLRMDHGDRPGSTGEPENGPWEVDLLQTSQECEGTNTVTIIANVKAPPPRAGPGYQFIPGLGYYKLHVTKATWEKARLTCKGEGAHLLIIDSEEEAAALKQVFAKYTVDPLLYIGASDIHTEGHFLTVFGQPLLQTETAKWSPNEPNDLHGKEDCVIIHRTAMVYNDVPCESVYPYVCEQEL